MSTTSILIIAHAPLAHALRECALHVFPDCGDNVAALDVQPNQPPEESLAQARIMLQQLGADSRLVTGVNLPMLLRAVSYRHEPLDAVVTRAVVGGTQGVMQVAISAPQNQNTRNRHDQDTYDHQQ